MPPIRITGDPESSVDRAPLDRARRQQLGHDVALDMPVCTASSGQLVLDGDGKVYVCEATECQIGTPPVDDLRKCWTDATLVALREQHLHGELPRSHCGVCVAHIERGLPETSALIRDHGTLLPSSSNGPRRLLLRFVPDAEDLDVELQLRRIGSVISNLDEIEIHAEQPFSLPILPRLVDLLHCQQPSERPQLMFRAHRIGKPKAAQKTLCDVQLSRITLTFGAGLRAELARARELVDDVRVRFVVDPHNWYEVERVADLCAEVGAVLDLRASDDHGQQRLTQLHLDEQRFVINELKEHWERFDGERCPSSLQPGEFTTFLTAIRRQARDKVEQASGEADSETEGQVLQFHLPPLDHPIFTDANSGGRLLKALQGLDESPSLTAWAAHIVRQKQTGSRLADLPWVRLLLLRVAMRSSNAAILEYLVRVYSDASTARLAAELAFASDIGLRAEAESWHEWFGLSRFGPRTAPFERGDRNPPLAAESEQDTADVTVLIPSYRHEQFIGDCIESVLAQSYPHLKVLVVDDQSPDATLARARTIDDSRLTVLCNDDNLGLGNSLLAALERVDTPYVALLNSDDTFHPDRIRRCREELIKRPDADLVATSLFLIDADGGEISIENTARLRDGIEVFNWVDWYHNALSRVDVEQPLLPRLLESNFLATSTNLFCRTEFLRSQADVLQGLKYCIDWQLFLTAAAQDRLVFVPEQLAAYRLHSSNTVWFHEGRRWTYFLEVNRVVATTLRRYLDRSAEPSSEGVRLQTLDLIVSNLVKNTETHGLGIYMNELLGGLDLEQMSTANNKAAALIRELNTETEHLTTLANIERELDTHSTDGLEVIRNWWRISGLESASFVGELYRDDFHSTQGAEQWLRGHCDQLSSELGELKDSVRRLDGVMHERRIQLQKRVRRLVEKIDALERGTDGESMVRLSESTECAVRGEPQQQLENALERLTTLSDHILRRSAALVQQATDSRQQKESLEQTLETERSNLANEYENHKGTLRHRDSIQLDILALQSSLEAANLSAAEQAQLLTEAEHARTSLADTSRELSVKLAQTRQEKARIKTQWRGEVEQIHSSREWRHGYFFWHKLPLTATIARRARKWSHRLAGFLRRLERAVRPPFRHRRQQASGLRVAAAAQWRFPIISHTFVYTELMGFRELLNADVCMMYWEDGAEDSLHEAFQPLSESAFKLSHDDATQAADRSYYRRKQPERYAELLRRISQLTQIDVADLEDNRQLLWAFTFTRNVERFGAQWIHTYFYYEQSLCGLVAQWFLRIPRGISSYADHVLDDYDLKLIPLHMETADVIVATSQRIRDELISLSTDEISAKIIVKPNGVDGRRFPYHERPVLTDVLELVSISRLEEKKGHLFLVAAVKQLNDTGKRVRVHIIGAADERDAGSQVYAEQLEDLIESDGLREQFVLHGSMKQEAMHDIVDRCHAFIAPYVETARGDKDGMPTAILEAMSSGLPILATDAGSITEIIDDGVEGLLCEQGSADALVQMITRMIDQPERVRQFSRAARARFERQFDIHVTEKILHARVLEIINGAAPGGTAAGSAAEASGAEASGARGGLAEP